MSDSQYDELICEMKPGAKMFVKYDEDKPRPDLLPPRALTEVSKVLAIGAHKYSDNNWKETPGYSRYYAAMLRHMLAWWGGEDKDRETGLSHLAHAACCVLFLLELDDVNEKDDRPNNEMG